MKKRKTILVLLAILVIAYLAWRYLADPGAATQAESPDLGVDRVWVDSQPERFTDKVHAFLMVDDLRLGIFQEASQWSGRFELFEYRREGAKVELRFPQDDRQASVEYTVTDCTDLHPYDLCLDLKENPWGGPTRYYSMRDQDSNESLRALAAALRAQVH